MASASSSAASLALPAELRAVLTARLGRIGAVSRASGGQISAAARVEIEGEAVFVKWNETAPPGLFEAEVDGLNALRAASDFIVPRVLTFDDAPALPFLALEWLRVAPTANAASSAASSAAFARHFAETLAQMHARPVKNWGYERDNYLGIYPQPNAPCASYAEFFRERRLKPHLQRARDLGRLPPLRAALMAKIEDNVERCFADFDARPSLLHGDLWSGNFLAVETAGASPLSVSLSGASPPGVALFDPAVWRGPREAEVAYIELFGGFAADFVPHLLAVSALQEGYLRRRAWHQLPHLLVHLNFFGEEYGGAVEAAALQALQAL